MHGADILKQPIDAPAADRLALDSTGGLLIDLDRAHRAIRRGDNWQLQRRKQDGTHEEMASWTGGRRSLIQRCEQLDIHPTRDAEQILAALPESTGFKERH